MSLKALRLVEAVVRPQLPANTKVFEPNYHTISGIGALGLFSNPKNIDAANSLFSEFNAQEKALKDEKAALIKELGEEINWDYYAANVEDKAFFNEAKSLYESIFASNKVPAIKITEGDVAEESASSDEIVMDAEFEASVNARIAQLQDTIENDINPLLNPFADFWTYELDGPEFAEVFEARPQWNDILNKAADEHAFHFTLEDPVLSAELQAQYSEQISNLFSSFKPETEQFELIKQIASGQISQQLNDHFTANYIEPSERALLEEYTHEDRAGYALRSAYVSQEVDPNGHHFTGH